MSSNVEENFRDEVTQLVTEQPNGNGNLLQDEDFLSPNSLVVLRKRYLRRNDDGTPAETAAAMFRRVAKNIASADLLYGATDIDVTKTEQQFFDLMTSLNFLPNSPTLRGAGRRLQQLAACFVIPIPDSLDDIFDAMKAAGKIHKTGGGVGYSFSRLRPRGDQVYSTGNIAGGPISFMKVFNASAQEITQGGVRMGANMGILRIDHPDILEFADIKTHGKELNNFNISAAATDEFMHAVEQDTEYPLVNPRTGKAVKKLRAREVFDKIAENAWQCGDPGLIFIDQMNRDNPTPMIGEIESTNPCGEQPLLPYESCTLGSIKLSNMIVGDMFDWEKLRQNVHNAVHFLDNVIDVNKYPLPEIERSTKGTRKIGLGVMGFADTLIQLGIKYDSEKGVEMGDRIMRFISQEALSKSIELAEKRGVFPFYESSTYDVNGGPRVRNACRTTVAPTGTIGVVANASGGIEPLFALVYKRETLFDKHGSTETLLVINPLFEKVIKQRGLYTEELMARIAETGSIQHVETIPEDIKEIFVTAHDIAPEWHVRMQAAFQKHIDSAVSKTINFPHEATAEDVKKVYMLAWKLGCKGITIYRDGSRDFQVLHVGKSKVTTKNGAAEKDKNDQLSLWPETKKPRARVLQGETHRITTPLGNTYVTINKNGDDQPFEVFLQTSKAGSDTAAVSEAIGRLISYILRLQSPVPPTERLRELVNQLSGIGGGRPLGFGPNRVLSLPDGVAQVLKEYLENVPAPEMSDSNNKMLTLSSTNAHQNPSRVGDLCPVCGEATFSHEEGCQKCYSCGHSEC